MAGVDHEQAFLDALGAIGSKSSGKEQTTELVETASKDHPSGTSPAFATTPKVTQQNFWRHPDAHPIVMDLLVLQKYGPEWLGWEPETLQIVIPESFQTQSLSDLNLAKLQACRTLHLVDTFWKQWEVFLPCTIALNEEFPDFEVLRVPTVAQCLVSCDIAKRIRDDVGWSNEMKIFLEKVYEHDGVFLPLPPVDFVQLEVPEDIDQVELARRWTDVRSSGHPPAAETILDEQLRRLLIVWQYLEESRARMNEQLSLYHV